MKIILLKYHLDKAKGDIIDVPEAEANYLIRCGVAATADIEVEVKVKDKIKTKTTKTSK